MIRKIFAGREVVVKLFTPLSLLVDTRKKSSCTLGVNTISLPPTPKDAIASTSPAPLFIFPTKAVAIVLAVSAPIEV